MLLDWLRRRPALAPSSSLMLGMACSRLVPLGAGLCEVATPALFALSAWARLRQRTIPSLALLCASLFLVGGWLDLQRRDIRHSRLRELFPPGVDAVELHFVGLVSGPVERDWNGQRWLRLRGGPEGAQAPGTFLVRLRIAADPGTPSDLDWLGPGDRVRTWCRLRLPADAADGGPHATGFVKSGRLVEGLERRAAFALFERVMGAGSARLRAVFPGERDALELVAAMLFGERAGIDPDTRRRLRDAGLVHLVAISGLHVGMLVGSVLALLQRGRLGPWPTTVVAVALLAGFVPGVGARPPVVRAATGAVLILVGRCLGRDGDGVNALALVAAGLATTDPSLLRNPGFQLTFLATFGILLLSKALSRVIPLPTTPASGIAVSTSAYLATAPAVAVHFGWLAPVAVLTNLVAVPLCAVVLATGYGAVLFADVPGLGPALARAVAAAARGLLVIADAVSGWSMGSFCVLRPHLVVLAAYYAALGIGTTTWSGAVLRASRRGVFLLFLAWIHCGPPPSSGSGRIETAVLDVGQGLAVAIRGPTGRVLLVDAGGRADRRFDPGERIVLPHLLLHGGRHVDVLVVTHDHVDHVGGAFAVARELEIGELWIGPGSGRGPRLAALRDLALQRGTAIVLVAAGVDTVRADVPVRVLAPSRNTVWRTHNDDSLVLLVGRPPARVLLPGDLEERGERDLLDSGSAVEAEALIVAHHGSRHGTGDAFLERVRPRWAIVSAGRRNPFGHPHPELLERLDRFGATVLRTDELGTVLLQADRRGWRPAIRPRTAAR